MNSTTRALFCAFFVAGICFAGKKKKPVVRPTCHVCEKYSEECGKVDNGLITLCSDVWGALNEHLTFVVSDAEFLSRVAGETPEAKTAAVILTMQRECLDIMNFLSATRAHAKAMRGDVGDAMFFKILYRDTEQHLERCIRAIVPQVLAMARVVMCLYPDEFTQNFCDELDRCCASCKGPYDGSADCCDFDAQESDLNRAIGLCKAFRVIYNDHGSRS